MNAISNVIGVTGAGGHIGNVLCRLLIQKGYQVKGLYHSDNSAIKELNMTAVKGSVLDIECLNQFVKGCDIVIHAAAIISINGDPDGSVFETNALGPKNLICASMEHGVKKIIHLSSTHAVTECSFDEPFTENRPYKGETDFAYDYSKAKGEQVMLKAFQQGKIQGCIVRPSSVVGLYDFKPSEIGKALIDFYNRKIPVLPPGGYNFIDVRDLCNAIINAIDNGRNGEVYLLSGAYHSMRNFASIVTDVTGIKTPQFVIPFWLMRGLLPFVKLYGKIKRAAPVFTLEAITALKTGHPHMINEKAAKELNLTCRPLKETIADFYDWQKQNGVIE